MATVKKRYNLQLLLSRIEKGITKHPKGGVAFDAGVFERWAPAISSALRLRPALSQLGQHIVVHQAIYEAAKSPPLVAELFLEEVNKAERRYLKRRRKSFTLVTQLSVQYTKDLRNARVGGAAVTFGSGLPKKFQIAHAEALEKITKHREAPAFSTWVRVRVKARTPSEAFEVACDQIDFLRGIWTLGLTRGHYRMSSGIPRPFNPVLVGPIFSAHNPDGNLATDVPWQLAAYHGPTHAGKLPETWSKVRSWERAFRADLSEVPYRDSVEQALRRYSRALDEVDWDTVFIKLWSILEALTFTGFDNYETTIRRTAFLYKDRELTVQTLRHLRDYRNRLVHEDESRQDRETVLCQLKTYVEGLIQFHVQEGKRLKTPERAKAFLDGPSDRQLLKLWQRWFAL